MDYATQCPYERITSFAHGIHNRLNNPCVDVEDVMQDAIVVYLETGDIETALRRIGTFYKTYARQSCSDRIHESHISIEDAIDDPAMTFVDASPLEISEEAHKLYDKLAELDADDQLIAYFLIKGKSQRAIALELEYTKSTMSDRIAAIRRHAAMAMN